MKLIVTRRVVVGGQLLFAGDPCDVNPALARTLIATRFARADDGTTVEGADDASAGEAAPPETGTASALGSGSPSRDELDDDSEDVESGSDDAEEASEEDSSGTTVEGAGDASATPKKNKKRKRSKR